MTVHIQSKLYFIFFNIGGCGGLLDALTERKWSQIAACRGANDKITNMRNFAPDTSVHVSLQKPTNQSHIVFSNIAL